MTGLRNSATTSRKMPIDSASSRFRWVGRKRAGATGSEMTDNGNPSQVHINIPTGEKLTKGNGIGISNRMCGDPESSDINQGDGVHVTETDHIGTCQRLAALSRNRRRPSPLPEEDNRVP